MAPSTSIAGAVTRVARRCAFALSLLALVVPARAELPDGARPRQMLVLPQELAPVTPGSGPLRVQWWAIDLPDDRRAQLMRASFWVRVGSSHHFRLSWDYVGLESDDFFRYGGGRTVTRWTTRLGGDEGFGVAIDLLGNLTTGDATLHPFSAQAPSAEIRFLARPWSPEGYALWLGAFGRLVSPPDEDQRAAPRSYFPSPHGWEAIVHHRRGGMDWQLHWRYDTWDGRDAQWLQLRGDVPVASDLVVQIGAVAGLGPPENRSLDYGWTLGLGWLPTPVETPPAGP